MQGALTVQVRVLGYQAIEPVHACREWVAE